MLIAVAIAAATACGRIDFDPLARDGSTSDGSSIDGGGGDEPGGPEAGSGGDAGDVEDAGGMLVDGGGGGDDPTRCDDAFASAIFCESWEAGLSSGVWPWIETADLNTVGVTTAQPYRGVNALQANAVNTGRSWVISPVLTPARTSGELWVRAYVYVAAGVAVPDIDTMQLVDANAPYDGVYLHIVGERAVARLSENDVVTSEASFPRDRWNCVAIGVGIDGTNGWVRLRTDTGADALLNGVDTLPAGGYGNIHAGLYLQGTPASEVTVYVDEIVVDDALIPCDPRL